MSTKVMETATEYPAHLGWDVVLRTGSTLHLRPVKPTDRDELLRLFRSLSPESLHQRYFHMLAPEAAVAGAPLNIDYRNHFALVGEAGGQIIAIADFIRHSETPEIAEVAFTISDDFQRRGIGTRLLEKLAEVARDSDITTFEATVLEGNQNMMDVFLDSGFEVTRRSNQGIIRVSLDLEVTPAFEDKSAQRSQLAASASMKAVFAPQSIAVIGAGRQRGQLGAELFHNLAATGFRGSLYPVNPTATSIEAFPAYASVRDIPGPVDLGIIVVPQKAVDAVVDDCIVKGVRALVVITAGYGETGADGRQREQQLLEKVRAAGLRMVGPNCMGVINTDPAVRMNAQFGPVYPPTGNVAMSTQSGALGLAILDFARRNNFGFSTFISVGNKADVSGNDLIQYWAEDPETDVILLYLESFGNPYKFSRIARRVARKKPIVAVKSGRSKAGARAAASHTGALAASDEVVSDLFRQAGVIRTETLEELFDVAQLLAHQPLPAGKRIAVVTNAGGPGILAADAAEARGLTLATLSDQTVANLRAFLPAAASVGNPVDMIASAPPDHYARTIEALLKDPSVEALVVIYIPVLPTDAPHVAKVIKQAALHDTRKPMIATFMGGEGHAAELLPVPAFGFPERAVVALSRAAEYAEWRKRPAGCVRKYDDFDSRGAREIVNEALRSGTEWLSPDQVAALLGAARIPLVSSRTAVSAEQAVAAARDLGFPVVLKAAGPAILHKTEVGGVKLSLEDSDAVRDAFVEFSQKFGSGLTGVVVQKMIPGGVETTIGATFSPTFGHLLVFGSGGILIELLADVSFRLHPVTDVEAMDMIDESKAGKLLKGFRGAKPADIDAVADVITRLSALIELCPEITELDMNPVKALPEGAIIVDARIRIQKVQHPATPSRRIAY